MATKSRERRPGRPPGTKAKASDAVRRVRDELGMTQKEMAKAMGIATSTLQRLERVERLPQGSLVLENFAGLAKKAKVEI